MKNIKEIINDVMSTLEVFKEFSSPKPGDVVTELKGILKPTGTTPEEYLEILHQRFKKNPQVFINSIVKLLKYKKEGIRVFLTTRPIWYPAVVRVFYRALAEVLAEKVLEYQQAQQQSQLQLPKQVEYSFPFE